MPDVAKALKGPHIRKEVYNSKLAELLAEREARPSD
jgi:hypothetical protein